MKLSDKQAQLLKFINNGGILKQEDNRLWMNGKVLNTKTLSSLMFKLHGENYIQELVKVVVIVDKA